MRQFSEWVDKELEKKNWNRAELSRRASISQASLSHIWKGDRNPGRNVCEAIAHALGYPPEVVFRIAGILPQAPDNDIEWEEWKYELSKLSPDKRASFLRMMHAEVEYESQQRQLMEAKKRKKTGPLPSL